MFCTPAPGEMKKTPLRSSLWVTCRTSPLTFTSLPDTGGTLRKSKILAIRQHLASGCELSQSSVSVQNRLFLWRRFIFASLLSCKHCANSPVPPSSSHQPLRALCLTLHDNNHFPLCVQSVCDAEWLFLKCSSSSLLLFSLSSKA